MGDGAPACGMWCLGERAGAEQMQSVYLANQTCWSPTDKFTQELRRKKRKKCKSTPFSLRRSSLSLAEVSFWWKKKPTSIRLLVFSSLCLCFPPVFLPVRPTPPSLFPLFVFFIFVIGVINGGRGWSRLQACFSAGLFFFFSAAKDGAGSNKSSPLDV